VPYKYQVEIFSRIREDWDCKDPPHYGHIVYLETGMGKTHIATMLLNYLFDKTTYEHDEALIPRNEEEMKSRIKSRDSEIF
jgi:superfamily II DNA or RNA helicase